MSNIKYDIDLDRVYKKFSQNWLKDNTIYQVVHGSYAYGTNIEGSDIDIRGICIPPINYLFGVLDKFEQAITNEPYDCTIFGIQKFVHLAMQGNPNALELLFVDFDDIIYSNEIGNSLLNIRDLFISKKCKHTFSGYAASQLKRIKLHRSYILKGELKKPERSDYNLPDTHKLIPEHQQLEIEAQIKKVLDSWVIDTTGMEPAAEIKFKNELEDVLIDLKLNHEDFHMYAARSLGLNDNLTEAFQRERAYKLALHEYKCWQTWKLERNKARFELEEKYGYDCKHASHLVRLTLMCKEILETHKINVKRPDAEFLLAIRNGLWPYDELMSWYEREAIILDDLYQTSNLRNEPERVKINNWLVNSLQEFYK